MAQHIVLNNELYNIYNHLVVGCSCLLNQRSHVFAKKYLYLQYTYFSQEKLCMYISSQ